MIPLTIVSDINGSPRGEDCENAGAVLDLEVEAEGINTCVHQVIRCMIYHCAIEHWARASGVHDDEGVFREGAQDPTGVVEEFEDLVTGVGDGRGDLQVLQPIDIDAGGQSLDGQAGGSSDCDRRCDKDNKGSAEGRGEHCEEGREGG